ncbi:hypothetical protein L7F22_012125 [Adiantum nelumboides]|nr:hypothetical protein [Adiantum nelumboides]
MKTDSSLVAKNPRENNFQPRAMSIRGLRYHLSGKSLLLAVSLSQGTRPNVENQRFRPPPFSGQRQGLKRHFTGKTIEERKALRDAKKCYICEEEGYFANECPQRNSQNKDDKSDRKGKKPKPIAGLVQDLCIVRDLGPQEAADLGVEKGLVGVNKEVMKYGLVQRRAKTAYKKDERFLLIVPGKLLLFKGMDIGGKHVRFVTSLFGASARLIYGQLEFEVIVPDSKSLNLLTPTAEELTGWIGAIEESVLFANGGLHEPGGQKSRDARANRRRDPENTAQEDRGVVGSRNIDPFFRDANIGNPRKAAVYANRSNDYEGGNFQRGANRQVVQREVAQRSEVCDFNLEDPVQSRRSGEVLNQRTERNPTYFRAEQRSRSNSLPLPSSVHSGDRDQNKAFDIEQQIKTRVNVASDGQEVLGLGNQSTKHARSPRKEFPDQRLMDNSVIIMESAEGRRREGRDFDEAESQAMFVRQGWSPSPGKGFVSQIQAGPSGANSDYSPGSTRAWDGNHSAFEDCSTSKGSSSLQTTSFYPELSQEGLSQASSSNPTELSSKSKRRSVKELEKMCFYLNLYRKGLTDSTTQTAS